MKLVFCCFFFVFIIRLTTLALNLRRSLMQGSARERCIALETCGLVVLTLQDNHNEFMRSIRATILKFIQSPKSTHVQIKVCLTERKKTPLLFVICYL